MVAKARLHSSTFCDIWAFINIERKSGGKYLMIHRDTCRRLLTNDGDLPVGIKRGMQGVWYISERFAATYKSSRKSSGHPNLLSIDVVEFCCLSKHCQKSAKRDMDVCHYFPFAYLRTKRRYNKFRKEAIALCFFSVKKVSHHHESCCIEVQ